MIKEKVLTLLEEQGFDLEEAGKYGYFFEFERLHVLYMPDDDDEKFLRFAVPNIYDVTEENKDLVLEVVNNTNMTIKYSKTCVVSDDVWIFYENRLFSEDYLEEIIEHSIRLLQATFFLFHQKIEGDDSLPGEDDDDNEGESKEDAA